MKTNKKRILLVASILALSAIMIFAGSAFAMGKGPGGSQNGGAYASTPGYGAADGGYGIGVRGAWAGGAGSLVETAARVLGLERIDLVAELSEGISIADAAANHGVAPQAIADAYLAIRSDFLAQLVADGRLSQEQADLMLAEMMDHVLAEISQPWQARAGASNTGYGAAGRDVVPGSGFRGQPDGLKWLDADGDGVCDNYDSAPQGRRDAARGGRWNR